MTAIEPPTEHASTCAVGCGRTIRLANGRGLDDTRDPGLCPTARDLTHRPTTSEEG